MTGPLPWRWPGLTLGRAGDSFTRGEILSRIAAKYDEVFKDTPDAVLVAGPRLRAALLKHIEEALDS